MSTFPRNGSHRNPGNACFNCTERRKLDVPIRASRAALQGGCRIAHQRIAGSARGSTAAISSPSGSTAGTSFIECTAISASPDSSTVSSSLTNPCLQAYSVKRLACDRPQSKGPSLQPRCRAKALDLASNLVRLPLGKDAFSRSYGDFFHWSYYLLLSTAIYCCRLTVRIQCARAAARVLRR